MKKLLALTLSLALATSIFAACGAKPASSVAAAPASAAPAASTAEGGLKDAEITWWAFPVFATVDGEAGKYENSLVAEFNKMYPNIKVNVEM
ncbi:MAG: carbohydrate ABC transporter substrate-binding protein, partial [Ruthenibacterium sp.]